MNDLHIITYKLHNKTKLRVEPVELDVSRSSCRAVLFDKLDVAKMHGLDTSNVSSGVETWRAKWNLGLIAAYRNAIVVVCRMLSEIQWRI